MTCQEHERTDAALRRIAAERGRPRAATGGRKHMELTPANLTAYARKYGHEGVLYTAYQAGYDDAALIDLAESLDNIRVAHEGRYARPLNGRQLRKQVDDLPKYLGVERV